MFLLRKPQQISNREMQPGQTLFQYLKRKKQIALRQSVQKELQKNTLRQVENSSIINTTFINQKQAESQSAQMTARSRTQTKRKQHQRKSSSKKKKVIDSSFQSNKNKKKQKQNKQNNFSYMNVIQNDIFRDDRATTRRTVLHSRIDNPINNMSVNIDKNKHQQQQAQQKQPRSSRSPFRSFISMISPLKNRCQNFSTLSNTKKCFQKSNIIVNQQQHNNNKWPLAKNAEFSTRKTIKQAMNKIQRQYNKQVGYQNVMKQKVRQFILTINQFLIHIEDDIISQSDTPTQKKLLQVKSQMKLLNNFIQPQNKQQQQQKQNISQIIDSLYQQINQTLNQFQGNVNKTKEKLAQQSIQNLSNQYQQKIEQLNKQKSRLSREISVMNKQNGKIQRDYDKLLEKYNVLVQQKQRNKSNKLGQQKQIRQFYEDQLIQLTQTNSQLTESLSELNKQLKKSHYDFDQYKQKVQAQKMDKTTVREDYLLKQIKQTKQQCAKDVENINKYYVQKLQQYPVKIKLLEELIQEQKQKLIFSQQQLVSLQNILKAQQKQKRQTRLKLQSALIDMCKINEELFKHWLGLKDIKTLSLRLGMFDKFERIYRDIPFDDRMFIL